MKLSPVTLTIVFYTLGNCGQAFCIRSCYEDLILTRKSHNCAEIAFIQGDSAGGSKLIEQTLQNHEADQTAPAEQTGAETGIKIWLLRRKF